MYQTLTIMEEEIHSLSTNEIVEILGKRFKKYRKLKKLTHKKIAETTGVSPFTISSFEKGIPNGLSLNSFINLLRTIDELEGLDKVLPEPESEPKA